MNGFTELPRVVLTSFAVMIVTAFIIVGLSKLTGISDRWMEWDNMSQQETIQEDDPGWDCRTMGNRSCVPANSQGVPAGDSQ